MASDDGSAAGATADLLDLRRRLVPRGVSTAHQAVFTRAAGARWLDVDGREWIDFAGGIGCLNAGAGNPAVVAALHTQVDALIHTCSHVAWHEPYLRVAERLSEVVPIDPPVMTMLVNSGAEAVENAVKVARAATGRSLIVAFRGSFHGRTYFALSLTGKDHPYKQGIGPWINEVRHADYAICTHCPLGLTYPDCGVACLEDLERVLAAEGDQVAAVIVEPVLGEGGFVIPPPEFLPRVAAMTRAAGALLIADEIQTGMGRTGKLFACEHSAMRPDILLVGKSLAGGLPLAAVTGRADVMDAPLPGVLGGTFGGNPLACAAALAAIDVLADPALLERGARLGERAMSLLGEAAAADPGTVEVRGLGAMVAVELLTRDGAPDAARGARLHRGCSDHGLLTMRAGIHDNVLRLHFPLTIDDATLDAGLDRLLRALEASGSEPANEGAETTAAESRPHGGTR